MAGFRPGFGRGGTTHSLLVRETVPAAVGGGDVADNDDAGFMISEGRRWVGSFTSKVAVVVVVIGIDGGEPTVDMTVCRGRLNWSELTRHHVILASTALRYRAFSTIFHAKLMIAFNSPSDILR